MTERQRHSFLPALSKDSKNSRYSIQTYIGDLRDNKLHLSFRQLAALIGVNHSKFSRYEQDDNTVPLGYFLWLVQMYKNRLAESGQQDLFPVQEDLLADVKLFIGQYYLEKGKLIQDWQGVSTAVEEFLIEIKKTTPKPDSSKSKDKDQSIVTQPTKVITYKGIEFLWKLLQNGHPVVKIILVLGAIALVSLAVLLFRESSNPRNLIKTANSYFDKGQFDDAIDTYGKAIKKTNDPRLLDQAYHDCAPIFL